MPETFVIQGRTIAYSRGAVSVADCVLDPQNPRIQFLVGQRAGAVSEIDLAELIWEKDSVKALGQSILQNGGGYEAVIIQRHGTKFPVLGDNPRACT